MGAAKSHGSGCIVAIGFEGGSSTSTSNPTLRTYLLTSIRGESTREEEEKEKTPRYKTRDGEEKALIIAWGVLLKKKDITLKCICRIDYQSSWGLGRSALSLSAHLIYFPDR